MKKLFTILLFFISFSVFATNYHVKTGGDDGANGLTDGTAWETITKVNTFWAAGSFAPGDSILFKRGDEWLGVTLLPTESGTEGNEIVVGAYNTGDDPIISGFTTLTTWADEGGGIWSKVIAVEDNILQVVMIDDVQYAMGRYPDAGTNLIYESFSTTVSITDDELPANPDWTDAEAVIEKNPWTLGRCSITNHSTHVLTYTNLQETNTPSTNDQYYFIQNHLGTLTTANEWYYDGSTLYVYLDANPSTMTIKVPTINNIVFGTSKDYLTFDNITFTGCNKNGIHLQGGDYNIIQDCSISYIGGMGIYIEWNIPAGHNTIQESTITYTNDYGIRNNSPDTDILNNTLSYIALFPGGGYPISAYGGYTSIMTSAADALIQYNNISYVGYNGISFSSGSTFSTLNNYITYAVQVLDDGGGVYTSGALESVRTIDGNIVTYSGVGNPNAVLARGIYIDESASNIVITNNTAANCIEGGFMLHKAANNTITGNLSFNNGYGIFYQESVSGSILTNTVEDNQFIAKGSSQYAAYAYSIANNISDFFTSSDYNYYCRPIDETALIRTRELAAGYVNKTLTEWQTLISDDANSLGSPTSVSDTSQIDFFYNATNANDTINLTKRYVEIDGTILGKGDYILEPWTSVVLMEHQTLNKKVYMSGGKVQLRNGKAIIR